MATRQDIDALLAVVCPHCGATTGEFCSVRDRRNDEQRGTRRFKPIPISTLDGGCHDARWRAALGRAASVIGAAVPHRDPDSPGDGSVAADPGGSEEAPEPELVGAPW